MVPWASTSSEARSPLRQGMDARDTPGTAREDRPPGGVQGVLCAGIRARNRLRFPRQRSHKGEGTSQHGSCGVVEDDAECIAVTRTQTADPMAHRDPVVAACTVDRPVMDREDNRLALPQGYDFAL